MPLAIVEREASLEVLPGRNQIPEPEQGIPQDMVSDHEEIWSVYSLGKAEDPRRELMGLLQLSPRFIKFPQSTQDRKKARGFAHLLAEFQRPGIGAIHLRGRQALGGNQ